MTHSENAENNKNVIDTEFQVVVYSVQTFRALPFISGIQLVLLYYFIGFLQWQFSSSVDQMMRFLFGFSSSDKSYDLF